MRPLHLGFLAVWLGWVGMLPAAAPGARLLSVQGKVEHQSVGATNWVPAQTNLMLKVRDRLRTHELSGATLQLADFSIIRISEFSIIEIVPPRQYETKSTISFKQGLMYFFHRNDAKDTDLETPTVNAAIEGTEFAVSVAPDGATTLVLVDGRVAMSNSLGQVHLTSGEVGTAVFGQAPRKTAALDLFNLIQWSLYYPGVIAMKDLSLSQDAQRALAAPLEAYRQGDLLGALKAWPAGYQAGTAEERLFLAGLNLSAGQITNYDRLIQAADREHPLASALASMVAAAQNRTLVVLPAATNASQLLGRSYYLQAHLNLSGALADARLAAQLAPDCGFAWARVAELEFSHGRLPAAREALATALQLSRRNAQAHALQGFIQLAVGRNRDAEKSFTQAIELDPQLANGWLGRGLSRIALRQEEAGRADLQAAVAAEPNRWVLRSYLAKAYSAQADATRDGARRRELLSKARSELELARQKAPADPTPWLYSALLAHQEYRTSEALRDLERSQELNDNRQVFRSGLLLDQDQAVRGANLAQIYELAGMTDVAQRESARAVMFDYANYSAHYNLAGSYFNLRDPTRFHLRHETEWLSEHLMASLLAPPGAGTLSQNLSQDEYARVFQQKKFGLSSSTEYFSTGEWRETATHFGTVSDLSYALDLDYQYKDGTRPNNDLSRVEWYTRIKQKITARDSVLLLAKYQDYESGDQFQYFNFNTARPSFRFREEQMPWLLAGYHREWSPGVHTLALAGRLVNDQWFSDAGVPQTVGIRFPALDPVNAMFDVNYRNQAEVYSGELNQIFQRERHTDILGLRVQSGSVEGWSTLDNVAPPATPAMFQTPVASSLDADYERLSLYAYHHWKPVDSLLLVGGLAYDWMDWPVNYRRPPLAPGGRSRDLLSPKAAVIWNPVAPLTLRGMYARSLGGISNEGDLRLEPTQLAGFSQAYRTLIAETMFGSVEAPVFDVAGGAVDLKLRPGTYATFEGQWKRSRVDRSYGYFEFDPFRPAPAPPALPAQSLERLQYQESSAGLMLNQVLGQNFFLRAGYQFTYSTLDRELVDLPATAAFNRRTLDRSSLHDAMTALAYQHRTGLFARGEMHWLFQDNANGLPNSDFPMLNLYAGYRFPRHRAELMLGVLNLTDEEYHLQALNYYPAMPYERTFYLRLKFNF